MRKLYDVLNLIRITGKTYHNYDKYVHGSGTYPTPLTSRYWSCRIEKHLTFGDVPIGKAPISSVSRRVQVPAYP